MPSGLKISTSTFQNCDGTNFTTTGVENNITNIGNASLNTYSGIGTSFDGNAISAILDIKGSVKYGESIFSGGFRVRNNISEKSQTIQVRLQPATATVPINDNSKLYATPYTAAKIDYNTGKTNVTTGIFGGVSFKIGKVNGFVEGQIYDFTHIDNSTTGINAGFSIPI